MDPSYKMGRQLEDWAKVTFMGDPDGIEGLRKKKKDSGTDLGKLRRDAVANGFNPLTVLRATGGQGFYKNEIPMGRLSSDAFFNTFDRIKQRNYNKLPPVIEPKMTGKEILAPVKLSNGKLNSDHKTAIYDVRQDPITLEYVTDGNSVFSAKQKPALFVEVDHRGNKWRFPWEDLEWDQVTLGAYKWVLQEAYYQGDRIGKNMRKKLGKMFGIYGYKADKQTIGNTIEQLDKLQKQMTIKNKTPQLSTQQFNTIRGLTNNARKTQDEINGFVRSDY